MAELGERRVCLVRFHDGAAKPNWGGRATSLGLARLIDRTPDIALTSIVNGDYVIIGTGTDSRQVVAQRQLRRARRRVGSFVGRDPRATKAHYYPPEQFLDAEAVARRALASPTRPHQLTRIVDAIEAADEVYVNGEGDLILADRPSLYHTLVIIELAVQLGRPVRIGNSILSDPTKGSRDPIVTEAVGRALARGVEVVYRDPESLRLHQELFNAIPARWQPDAVFTWAPDALTMASVEVAGDRFGPLTERLGHEVQRTVAHDRPYVVVSGSSSASPPISPAAVQQLSDFIGLLRARDVGVVVAATCGRDDWMVPVARAAGVAATPADIPLASGMYLLAHASAFVSGRYHPSILAALAGVTPIWMTSNSHKNRSLQEVLGRPAPHEWPFFGDLDDLDDLEALADVTVDAVARHGAERAGLQDRARRLADQVTYSG